MVFFSITGCYLFSIIRIMGFHKVLIHWISCVHMKNVIKTELSFKVPIHEIIKVILHLILKFLVLYICKHFCLICIHLTEGISNLRQIIDEDDKQNWPKAAALGYTTWHWWPLRENTSYTNSLTSKKKNQFFDVCQKVLDPV